MDNSKARRKSFLCWAPDVIFNEKDNSDTQNCIEVFPHERPVLDQCGYTEQVVTRNDKNVFSLFVSVKIFQTVPFRDKLITASLIFVTAVSVCFLFWYQNFGKGKNN